MRRTIITLAAFALLLPLTVASTTTVDQSPSHSPGGQEVQRINGTIALPTRFTDGEGGFPGLGRRLFNCSQDTNGVISYIAPVHEWSWGGPFEITDVTAEATTPDIPDADIDVFLYEELADCAYPGAAPVTLAEYAGSGPGEVGFIPERTRFAVVFTPTAIDAAFTMRLYSPPVINIADGDFELSVASGATVVWHNDTGDYAYVRALDGSFDSSPDPATGIRNGDDFRQSFTTSAGTKVVEIETSAGTGTITVTS